MTSKRSTQSAQQPIFVVIRTRGPAWQESQPLEGQADWAAHASFMDALAEEGCVIFAGPLQGTSDALIVMRASSPDEVRSRLATDPWTTSDLLRTTRVAAWTLRLGSVTSKGPAPPDGLPAYRVLTGPDDAAFCHRVSEALSMGYRLHEGPSITSNGERVIVAQALVWPTEES